MTPVEGRLEQEKLLEHLTAVEYGLPYDTPEEKALVREIYQWQQAEGGGNFIVKKHYHRGVRLPVLTTGNFPTWEFVQNALWDTYGGGVYLVHKGNTPRILARYEVAGPGWFRPHAKVANHAPFEE